MRPIRLRPQADRWIGLGLLFVAAGILYACTALWPDTPDGLFHLHRIRALKDALRAGVLYPRWFPEFSFGYGYPVLNFYAPLFYYPPALLHWLGFDLLHAARLTVSGFYALSGLAMYLFLRRWAATGPALVGAAFYVLFPYRLYDLFVRGALPEFAAFLWLPLIAAAIHAALTGSSTTTRIGLLGVVAWAGLILTHNLTALMTGLMMALLLVTLTLFGLVAHRVHVATHVRNLCQLSGVLTIPLLLGAALSAFYVIPALAEARWVGIGATAGTGSYATHFANWRTLFAWDALYPYPNAAQPTVPVPGIVVLLLLASCIGLLPRARPMRAYIGVALLLSLGSLWLMTTSSAPIWEATAVVLGKLQFPWRWQIVLVFSSAMLAAALLQIGWRRSRFVQVLGVGLCLLSVSVYALARLPHAPLALTSEQITREQMWAFDAAHGQVGASWTGEFLPRWVSAPRWAIGRAPADAQSAAATVGQNSSSTSAQSSNSARPMHVSYFRAQYMVDFISDAPIVFHQFYYPAWRVLVDGEPIATFPAGPLGLLTASVPTGQHVLSVDWRPTAAVWVGQIVSIGALGLLLAVFFWKNRRLRWSVFTVCAVAILLLASPFAQAQNVQPHSVGADFGAVRLEAAHVEPVRAGGIAQVELHWFVPDLVRAGGALIAFVHVIGPDGQVIAQHDGPLAGPYTPPARWLPGQVLQGRHPIPISTELMPGRYGLKAGVYPAGRPQQALVPANGDGASPRVDVGVLEVLP